MKTKLGKLVTYSEVKTPKKSNFTQTTWSCEVTWQTKNEIFLFSEDVWPPNVAGCWRVVRRRPNKVTWLSDYIITRGHVPNWRHKIYSSSLVWPSNLAEWWFMVTGGHPWNQITLWLWILARSYEKYVISPLPQGSWSPSLAGWWLRIKGLKQ